jgi:hypothetical protein
MSQERRKKSRFQVASQALAFISDNVTEYAANFSAGILDVCEDGVGLILIGNHPEVDKKYLMSFIDSEFHIKNISILFKYDISLNGFDGSGKKYGAAFTELTEAQKKDLQSFIARQIEQKNDL